MRKKVGLFGGTFDPFHLGHLNLAISLKEAASLDLVFFVPVSISPFKQERVPVASGEHRFKMLKRAVGEIPGFEVLDLELKRPGPSYTIDTVRELSLLDPTLELHLLLAEEHLLHFSSWKEADLLIQLAPPLIGVRSQEKWSKHSPFGTRVQTPYFEISSTLIRERLSQKKYCGHLLPFPVLEYIQQHQLYAFDEDKSFD